MFWDSVVSGLKVLTYWETYVASLLYLVIYFIPMVISGKMIIAGVTTGENEHMWRVARYLGMILMPVLQATAIAVMILVLSPIIFGFAEDVSWSFPWQLMIMAPGSFFKLVSVLVVALIFLAFVPVINHLTSLKTLVLGSIVLIFYIDSINPVIKSLVNFNPGFWFSTGFIAIAGIMSLVTALVSMGIEEDMVEKYHGELIMLPIAGIFSFIPLFMYGAWLGAQVRGGY